MKALTLTCPWAHAIAYWGKPIENRGWLPPESLIGQRLAIHAGKSPWRVNARGEFLIGSAARAEVREAAWFCRRANPTAVGEDVTCGWLHDRSSAILAVVTVAGWFRSPSEWRTMDGLPPRMSELGSPWFVGPVGWVLTDVVALPMPVACKGAQGLWSLPADVEAQVREQLARAGGAP